MSTATKNEVQVARAQRTIEAYQAIDMDMFVGADLFTCLLVDLRHWADANNVDIYDAMRQSFALYCSEKYAR